MSPNRPGSGLLLRLLPLGALISVVAFGLSGWAIVHKDDRLENALLALCALQDDLERRVLAGQQFIEEHPNGIPGISRTDLERSIQNQQMTLGAIDPYLTDCPEDL